MATELPLLSTVFGRSAGERSPNHLPSVSCLLVPLTPFSFEVGWQNIVETIKKLGGTVPKIPIKENTSFFISRVMLLNDFLLQPSSAVLLQYRTAQRGKRMYVQQHGVVAVVANGHTRYNLCLSKQLFSLHLMSGLDLQGSVTHHPGATIP